MGDELEVKVLRVDTDERKIGLSRRRVDWTAEEEAKYNELQQNEQLKSFHSKHAGGKEITADDIAEPKRILRECFDKLEHALDGNEWIMGAQFTLADISWVPVHFVLTGCGYPFDNYPNITRRADTFSKRDSYKKGILDWCVDFSKV